MSIEYTDVKLFQSVNNDSIEIGVDGRRSSIEVFDGFLNNLFLGVSRIDAIQGELAIRGVHALIDTANNDAYMDAHVILSEQTNSDFIKVWLIEGTKNGQNNFQALKKISNNERVYALANLITQDSATELSLDNVLIQVGLTSTDSVENLLIDEFKPSRQFPLFDPANTIEVVEKTSITTQPEPFDDPFFRASIHVRIDFPADIILTNGYTISTFRTLGTSLANQLANQLVYITRDAAGNFSYTGLLSNAVATEDATGVTFVLQESDSASQAQVDANAAITANTMNISNVYLTCSSSINDGATVVAPFHFDDQEPLSRVQFKDSDPSFLNVVHADIYHADISYSRDAGIGPLNVIEDTTGGAQFIVPGDICVVFEDFEATVPGANLDGFTQTTIANITYVDVININDNQRLARTNYTVNFATGDIDFIATVVHEDRYGNALDASSAYEISWRISEMNSIAGVLIDTNEVTLDNALVNTYSSDAKIAPALLLGNLQSKATSLFSQELFNLGNPVWSNSQIGDNSIGQYNVAAFPVQLFNNSAITERWAIYFTSPTTVNVVGEESGTVLSGHNINTVGNDLQPVNPLTGLPYFSMDQAGFGSGWVQGNVIRLNTEGASHHFYVGRTVLPGVSPNESDYFDLECRGDI